MTEQQQPQKRLIPQSELDFYFKTTESAWGKSEVPQELKDKLQRLMIYKDENGNVVYDKDEDGNPVMRINKIDLWSLLSFYSRDMRLSNLSYKNNEIVYCQYWLDFAEDMLQEGFLIPFITALSRAVSVMELAQSKGGFLRKQMNTITTENINQELEPPKKSILGFGGSKR